MPFSHCVFSAMPHQSLVNWLKGKIKDGTLCSLSYILLEVGELLFQMFHLDAWSDVLTTSWVKNDGTKNQIDVIDAIEHPITYLFS